MNYLDYSFGEYDYTTMPTDAPVNWNPGSVLGQAIRQEPWKNVPIQEKHDWIKEMNSERNRDTFISKLLDFECFMAIIVRDDQIQGKIIVLEDFQRFTKGPIFYGPYNWPDQH